LRQESTGAIVKTKLIVIINNLHLICRFFIIGYYPAAFEFAAELTYPEPEASSAGVMTFGCQIMSVLYTLAYGWVFNPYGDLAANLFMSVSMVVGTLLLLFVKSDLRRQRAETQR